ncbi:zinc finger HIT domain-containing protein 2 [Lampris incognitus]|uniref:zinc finger HIT domain-containing protein 2 n=1 Tax=Lampris incognitus TaxID=2546036 RepID=UPI0024B51199|nr:zinc finger HIT domain-containing protein 2 [Lampris incognitus]
MNRLLRQRLPLSVRNLLTDIGPKDDHCTEWTETEPGTVTKDGIVLPSIETVSQEEFLTPARTQSKDDTSNGENDLKCNPVCGVCHSKPSCYTCPRCNIPYCCLACYRSSDHNVCSEEFYRESVLQELSDMGKTEDEGRKKMHDILLRLRQKAASTEGGMGGVLREVGIQSDGDKQGEEETKEGAQALGLLSRLVELQQSGEGSMSEIKGILRQLKNIGRGEVEGGENLTVASVGDLDDGVESDENELDLADRLSGLDIDVLSEDELWELLNSQEKEKFMNLIRGGAFGGLVPLWSPWWEMHEDGGRALVEVLEEEVNKRRGGDLVAVEVVNSEEMRVTLGAGQKGSVQEEDTLSRSAKTLSNEQKVDCAKAKESLKIDQTQELSATKLRQQREGNRKETSKVQNSVLVVSRMPQLSAKIPKLSSLTANPSPLVCYGLVNALFGYTFTVSFFNGDTDSLTHEFCDMVLAVSEALSSSRVFSSLEEALECGETAISAGGYFDRDDPSASSRAIMAVAHIMSGRSRQDAVGYCLAALSHLRSAFSKARAALPKGGQQDGKRQKQFLARKKCEFFQAWVSDNANQTRRLAIRLWNEHSSRKIERSILEKEKQMVEESWKRGKRKGNCMLIEELS